MNSIAKIVLVALVVLACSRTNENESVPDYILNQKKMTQVMTDVLLIEGARTGDGVLSDTLKLASYYKTIWEKHQITQAEFDTSFSWYSLHPKKSSEMFGEIIIKLQQLEVDLQKNAKSEIPEEMKEQIKESISEGLVKKPAKTSLLKKLEGEK